MSKEIEALKRIETTFSMNKQGKESVYRGYTNSVYPYYKDFDLVLNALKRFDIIKDKDLLIDTAHNQIFRHSKDYSSYCKLFKMYRLSEKNLLDKEEFNILKKEGF